MLKAAKRHIAAAEAHERKVATFEESAVFLEERGESEQAAIQRGYANAERDAARDEWDRAAAIQGPTQFTEPKKGDRSRSRFRRARRSCATSRRSRHGPEKTEGPYFYGPSSGACWRL